VFTNVRRSGAARKIRGYKKLSYRKQIARQLRTQDVEGIYSNYVTYMG